MDRSWDDFLSDVYVPKLQEVDRLCEVEDPESEPFKSKEQAILILEELHTQACAYHKSESEASDEVDDVQSSSKNSNTRSIGSETDRDETDRDETDRNVEGGALRDGDAHHANDSRT